MKNLAFGLIAMLITFGCSKYKTTSEIAMTFEDQVNSYIEKYPYQETYNYMVKYTGKDPSKLNNPVEMSPALVSAGEDVVVRTNNDTYYTGGFLYLESGPVKLSSSYSDPNRFYSFQLMDDKNCNFQNLIRPKGNYYLYIGDEPSGLDGELIKAPSAIVGVITRVEVKDKHNAEDVEQAKKIYEGLDISGPEIEIFPELDLLSSFDDGVREKAMKLMDSVSMNTPFRELVATAEMIPDTVSFLEHAAATKSAWGAPVAEHSTYELIFHDDNGEELNGSHGEYHLSTDEPAVDGFWSLTVYDTERGGFLHPNRDNRYHINGTSAKRNHDGTITFIFKTSCDPEDLNCVEVPEGQFDLTARYYLPSQDLISGKWKMNRPVLTSSDKQ